MATPSTLMPTIDPTNFGNKPGDGPLRPGGTSDDGLATSKGNRPDTRSPSSEAQRPSEKVCRDCAGGNERIRQAGLEYLPQAAGERPSDYQNRALRSVFHGFFGTALSGLVGLIFRKDPVLGEDVPPPIVEHWENIDLTGTHGDVFLKDIEEDAMTAGHAAILVEFPTMPEGATRADEQRVRPYWVPIKKKDILSWRTQSLGGETVLMQVVIEQQSWVADGQFGEKLRKQYLVIQRGVIQGGAEDGSTAVVWRLMEINEQGVTVTVNEGRYRNQDEIPISEVPTSGRKSMFNSTPPLLDVAFLNLAHYQMWSDYQTSIHKTCVPLLLLTGVDGRDQDGNKIDVVVGPNTVLTLENPQARGMYVSHSGEQLDNVRDALNDIKSDIGTLSLAMLSPQKRQAETAEAKRLDKEQTDSALSTTARGLQDAVERALGFHAKYMGLDSGGSIVINRDFEGMLMDAPIMQAYATLTEQGFPPRIVLKALQDGGRIPEDEDLVLLEAEFEANRMAEQEQKADMAAQMNANRGDEVGE